MPLQVRTVQMFSRALARSKRGSEKSEGEGGAQKKSLHSLLHFSRGDSSFPREDARASLAVAILSKNALPRADPRPPPLAEGCRAMFTSRELVLAAMFLRVFQPTKYLSRAARYTPTRRELYPGKVRSNAPLTFTAARHYRWGVAGQE